MARHFRRKQTAHPIADLNVTNLIDLGFMLLVIFMIATPLIQQEQKIPVNLPVQSAQPQQKPDPKDRFETITVQADGRLLLGNRPYTMRQLLPELAKFAAESKPPVIQVRTDADAKMQYFVSLMDELHKHNLTRVSIPTQLAK
jgi:biopolymer transport protein TolR